jgi:type IV pilus assembly protein PilA
MNSPTTHDPCRRLLGTQGFTLVEIMIVVVIIGLLAAMAVPAFQRIRRNVQNKTFANDLRQIRGAAEQYIMEQSAYPEDGTPGAFPAGLAEYLPSHLESQRTPVGGLWDWDYKQFGCTAGISVYQPMADAAQMQELDALIDDGDLSSGNFRARSDGYIYVIVP